MKVAQINAVCGKGSTGKICVEIGNCLDTDNIENKIYFISGNKTYKNGVKYSNAFYTKFMALFSRVFGNYGFNSSIATRRLVKKLKEFDPDIIHLHNLHGHNVDLKILFNYLSKSNKKVVWTFHDCWAFTAYCPHFTMVKCDKWKEKCGNCPQKSRYPKSLVDNSEKNYERKKRAFTGVENMTLITPSKWLADLVKQSFLKDYPIEVVYNTIDTEIFKPTPSDFRERYGLGNKKIILGVASVWDERKGFYDFVKLSEMLDENYQIVLVGISQKQKKKLPKNILAITRTDSAKELAEIYTAADVFLNLTYEDNYPTVNLEAQACGTPCITYRTGGSVESVPKENVVPRGDIDSLIGKIKNER